jgi:hypothetical protein
VLGEHLAKDDAQLPPACRLFIIFALIASKIWKTMAHQALPATIFFADPPESNVYPDKEELLLLESRRKSARIYIS